MTRWTALDCAALRGIDLSIWPGEMVAVVGSSGRGKTTVLKMITAFDRPSAGRLVIDGADIGAMEDKRLARWRVDTVRIALVGTLALAVVVVVAALHRATHLRPGAGIRYT